MLSLLALKLVGVRRVSHVKDLAGDPAAAVFAGLAALPKATALTTYSHRLAHERQRRFLAALDAALLGAGFTDRGPRGRAGAGRDGPRTPGLGTGGVAPAKEARRWEPKRLRLFSAAGRLAVSGRRVMVHLSRTGAWSGLLVAPRSGTARRRPPRTAPRRPPRPECAAAG